MPRPTTRSDLIEAAQAGYEALASLIGGLPVEQASAEFAFADRDRNVRDVIAHLVAWHRMMLRWYAEGMAGDTPSIPAAGYSWRTLPALNQQIWQAAQTQTLSEALLQLQESHRELMAVISRHNDVELFTKRQFRWTGSTSLGSYLISSTSSHYDWALKKLRRAVRAWAT
ncbi:MAG: hypothetical protein CVT62_10410 [Actinobacteria bacterium HGW-Actinobacteria-2]|nr:MAG: hypothetical protein CVT62_10410 [Actinobacteria bacterium HGW-Actinobacteria-2]